MNSKDFVSYQYSIIRYYHDATTQEFLNIGVAVFSRDLSYFRINITNRYSRITDTFYNADGDTYRNHVNRILRRFEKLKDTLSKTDRDMFLSKPGDIEDLLRKYLRKESSIQYSQPTSGIASNSIDGLDDTFNHLFYHYVEKYINTREPESRNDEEVWRSVYRPKIEKIEKNILGYLTPKEVVTPIDNLKYDHAWKNGKWHLIQVVSFDLMRAGSIIEKAHRYLGKNVLLNSNKDISSLYMLLGEPKGKDKTIIGSYDRAKDIVRANGFEYKLKLVEENEADDFARYLWNVIPHTSEAAN